MRITIDAPATEPYDIALPAYAEAIFDHARGRVTLTVPDDLAPADGEDADAWCARLADLWGVPRGRFAVTGLTLDAEVPGEKTLDIVAAERAGIRPQWSEAEGRWQTIAKVASADGA